MMLQRRYRVAPGGGGAALPDGAISMADFGEEAPEAQRERTVVDIRVSAKLDNKRRQVEMAGLRRKNIKKLPSEGFQPLPYPSPAVRL